MKNSTIFLLVIGLVVLGILFIIFKPNQESQGSPQGAIQTTQTASPSSTMDSKIKTFELVVKEKKLVSGSNTLSVNEGDDVTIKITSDEEEEFHLHGYDKFVDLSPNQQAELKFNANLTGRFVFELEHVGIDLGALEVQPKQ